MPRFFKKLYWFITANIAKLIYPTNDSLTYIGVTGTDGKTTTCNLVYEIALSHGYKPLLISTVGAKFDGEDVDLHLKSTTYPAFAIKQFIEEIKKFKVIDAFKSIFDYKSFLNNQETHRTTPLAIEIRKAVLEYEKKGADFFIIESTSHALDQYRVYGFKFDAIAYTNITNEHLDYHGSWENYAEAKSKLIDMLKPNGIVTINQDDVKSYDYLKKKLEKSTANPRVFSYFVANSEEINENDFYIEFGKKKNEFTAINATISDQLFHIRANLKGKYNVSNILAAFSCFYGINSSNPNLIIEGINNLKQITGRMNIVNLSPMIIIDFAHTPNAFYNALKSINEEYKKLNNKIWVVFGTAGERDKYKRPEMGKFAYQFCDNILITLEDCRSESLFEINNQIIEGFKYMGDDFTIDTYYPEFKYERYDGKFVMRFDEPSINARKNAIKFAIENSGEDDVIVILGKGHETTMNVGGTEYPWSDKEVVKDLIP